jgi:hypothetical protein
VAALIRRDDMLQSFKSAFLLMALEYILTQSLDFVKSYTVEKEKEVEEFVKGLIPGTDFDALGWGIVQSLMPKVFEVAYELVDKIDGVDNRSQRMAMMVKAVAGITV